MEQDYLIKKPPFQALFLFALPIIIGNLFQQTYTMADSAIVGRFVSEQALAAVGASYSLTNIFICVAIGGGMGASVIVSQYFGAQKYDRMKTAIYTASLAFLGLSLLLSILGLFCSREIMILLNTPADCLSMASEYLRIYFLGLPFLFMYNVFSSMFNALGKSRIPLGFLIFSSLFNIVLDYILVVGGHMGIAGVAWATLIAQGISAVLSMIVLLQILGRMSSSVALMDDTRDTWTVTDVPAGEVRSSGRGTCSDAGTTFFDGKELASMTRIAIPSILQQSTVSIGMMLVQSVVNSFGSAALAGFSAAMRVESMCIVPMSGIGNAVSSYTAQNLGAGKTDRVVKGYHAAIRMVIFCAVVLCVILELFHQPIMTLFLGADSAAEAFTTGENYLTFMGWFFCLIGLKMSVDGLLRGSGDMLMFTIANLVNLSIRVIVAMTCAPRFGIAMVWCAVPIGWAANFLISYGRYRTGKWKERGVV